MEIGEGDDDGVWWTCPAGWAHADRRHSETTSAEAFTNAWTLRSEAVKLLGGPWELAIRPERGGRIISLRLGGDELLDQGIGVDDPAAESFVAAGAWGWDEMVPNVDAATYPGPGPWAGTQLPDHGEAWRLPWSVVEDSGGAGSMECSGRLLPWRLRRRIDLTERSVRVDYLYENRGAEPMYAYWCAHPLFRFEAGMDIGVERGEDLAGLPEGTSTKRFLRRGSIDRVRLGWQSGAAIEVAWDSGITPYVGVWVCNGDLGGYRQLAIEPATGGGDRPHVAVPPPLLDPGGELRWWLEIRDLRV